MLCNSAVSGEAVAFLEEHEGKTAKDLKSDVAAQSDISRFRQKLWSEDWSHEIPDDEVFTAEEVKMQLVLSEFWPPESEQHARMIAVSEINDPKALEKMLQCPRNPNFRDETGWSPLHYAAANGHVEAMRLLLEAGAEKDARDTRPSGWTPLLESGSDAGLATLDLGGSPLHLAAQVLVTLTFFRSLIAAAADRNFQPPPMLESHRCRSQLGMAEWKWLAC